MLKLRRGGWIQEGGWKIILVIAGIVLAIFVGKTFVTSIGNAASTQSNQIQTFNPGTSLPGTGTGSS